MGNIKSYEVCITSIEHTKFGVFQHDINILCEQYPYRMVVKDGCKDFHKLRNKLRVDRIVKVTGKIKDEVFFIKKIESPDVVVINDKIIDLKHIEEDYSKDYSQLVLKKNKNLNILVEKNIGILSGGHYEITYTKYYHKDYYYVVKLLINDAIDI